MSEHSGLSYVQKKVAKEKEQVERGTESVTVRYGGFSELWKIWYTILLIEK